MNWLSSVLSILLNGTLNSNDFEIAKLIGKNLILWKQEDLKEKLESLLSADISFDHVLNYLIESNTFRMKKLLMKI